MAAPRSRRGRIPHVSRCPGLSHDQSEVRVFTDLLEPKGRRSRHRRLGDDPAGAGRRRRSSSSIAASCRPTGPIRRRGARRPGRGPRRPSPGCCAGAGGPQHLHARRRPRQGRLVHARPARHRPRRMGLRRVAPFYVDAEASAPGGLPQGGETRLAFPNSHLAICADLVRARRDACRGLRRPSPGVAQATG